ncbi:MAG: acyl-CoA dehydrogenase family protein [Candidatus Yanofskybacteria bacterium]|nr:acyl-CoA dehydrogenase family protein [Candidatus Yanofskybacteria bacterium]
MSKEFIRISVRNGLGKLTLNSNDHNTLSGETIFEIGRKFEELESNPDVKVVVITGDPKSLFSAGADVGEIHSLLKAGNKQNAREVMELLQAVLVRIEKSTKPTIAAINGYCFGGGLELALACQYRVAKADASASIGLPEIGLGIIPGLGGTQRLPRLVGAERAVKILFGGMKALVSPGNAKIIGLVDRVIEGDFGAGVKSFCQEIIAGQVQPLPKADTLQLDESCFSSETFQAVVSGKASTAVNAMKDVLRAALGLPLAEALKQEQSIFIRQAFSPDGIEGVSAYLENKRKPKFSQVEGESTAEQTSAAKETNVQSGGLTEEYEMLRQTLREFGANEIRPKVDDMEREGNIFPDIIGKMAELGLFGVPFADTYGGAGLGKTGYCIMMEELCRVHGSVAVLVGASTGLTGGSIALYGTEAQKQKYLRAIAEGKAIGAFALTEAEAGSDVANIMSIAEKRGDKWVINGTKQFISNGDIADVVVVFAKTDRDLGANGISAFIVEKGYPGFKTTKVEHKMGIRASRTTSMEFTDMEVLEENVLGQLGQGFKIAMNALNYGRLSLAAGCIGASKRAFELAYAHASQRSQMGKKLIEFEVIQFYFARMRSDIFLMESSVYPVAAMADRGEDIRLESAIVKLTASEMSGRVIDTALQIHGGVGYMDEYEISRLYRDARINPIFEGTNEIQQLLIFKEIFKSGGKI